MGLKKFNLIFISEKASKTFFGLFTCSKI